MDAARCTGHCCRAFTLSSPYAELEANPEGFQDGRQLLDMVIKLEPAADGREVFTCRHFDGSNCGIYDRRPTMCRAHGTVYPCANPGCTLRLDTMSSR